MKRLKEVECVHCAHCTLHTLQDRHFAYNLKLKVCPTARSIEVQQFKFNSLLLDFCEHILNNAGHIGHAFLGTL